MILPALIQLCRIRASAMLVASLPLAMLLFHSAPVAGAIFHNVDTRGHVNSGTANFSTSGDVLTLTLTNTTPVTEKVNDLLTGIEFSLSGLAPTLTSVTGVLRTVHVDGTCSDDTAPSELSWSLKPLGSGIWHLDSHPNAQHSVIGPAGNYGNASRSVRGNPGHNPFAVETITATFNVPGLRAVTSPFISVASFGFSGAASGTISPSGSLEVPEPTTAAPFAMALALAYMPQRGRRY